MIARKLTIQSFKHLQLPPFLLPRPTYCPALPYRPSRPLLRPQIPRINPRRYHQLPLSMVHLGRRKAPLPYFRFSPVRQRSG